MIHQTRALVVVGAAIVLAGGAFAWTAHRARPKAVELAAQEPPSEPPPAWLAARFVKTTQIPDGASLGPLVEALASRRSFDSETVGEGGTRSHSYSAYATLAGAATREQALALAFHESPIVRAYFAVHVCEKLPDDVGAIQALLADPSSVDTRSGCSGGESSVRNLLLTCMRAIVDRKPAQEVLLATARDPRFGKARAGALELIREKLPAESVEVGRAWLVSGDGSLLPSAILALGESHDPRFVGTLAPYASDRRDDVRIAVAQTLLRLGTPSASPLLESMLDERDPYVRENVARAYVASPGAKRAIVDRLLTDPIKRLREAVARSLAMAGTAESVAALEAYLAAHPTEWEPIRALPREPPTAPAIELARRSARSPDVRVAGSALDYLAAVRDASSRDAFRAGLRHADLFVRRACAAGLGAIGDLESVPALEDALSDTDDYVVLGSAQSLGAMRAKRSVAALRMALDRRWTYTAARREVEKIADELDAIR